MYKGTLVVENLDWDSHDFVYSSVCLSLLEQMGIWQDSLQLVKKAR